MKNKQLTLFALLYASITAANSQTIINGDFEDTTGLTGPGTYLQGNLVGWTGSVQLVSTTYNPLIYSPTNGAYVLDWEFSSGSSIYLEQVVTGFTYGQMYSLNYEVGNRGPAVAPRINIGSGTVVHTMSGVVNMTPTSLLFTATGTSQYMRIVFSGGTDNSVRGTFDNFTITKVPEPSTVAVLGLSGLCVLLRRRRR